MVPWPSVVLYLAVVESVVGEEESCEGRDGFFPSLDQCDKYYECRDDKVDNILASILIIALLLTIDHQSPVPRWSSV